MTEEDNEVESFLFEEGADDYKPSRLVGWERRECFLVRKVTGPEPPPRFSRTRFGTTQLFSVVPRVGRYRTPHVSLWVRPDYYTGTSWLKLEIGPLTVQTRERTDHERGVREDAARRRTQ